MESSNEKGIVKPSLFTRIKYKLFSSEPQNREDLVEVIKDSAENSVIDNATLDMLEGVIEMSDLRVRDIMMSRAQITFIPENASLDECVQIISASGHSRFPVICEGKDNVVGLLFAKDLLKFAVTDNEEFTMHSILRSAVIIPESKKVDRMLKEFRSERFHMALVVDEFGAISGLVTIEDILEQIVGDIEDEYSDKEDDIHRLSEHSFRVSALTDIEDFNEYFATNFDDEEVDTVGGLVIQAFGKLPQKGETITISDIEFKVTSADIRRLEMLRVTLLDEQLSKAPCKLEN